MAMTICGGAAQACWESQFEVVAMRGVFDAQ
jgi:hypothetical protein